MKNTFKSSQITCERKANVSNEKVKHHIKAKRLVSNHNRISFVINPTLVSFRYEEREQRMPELIRFQIEPNKAHIVLVSLSLLKNLNLITCKSRVKPF